MREESELQTATENTYKTKLGLKESRARLLMPTWAALSLVVLPFLSDPDGSCREAIFQQTEQPTRANTEPTHRNKKAKEHKVHTPQDLKQVRVVYIEFTLGILYYLWFQPD